MIINHIHSVKQITQTSHSVSCLWLVVQGEVTRNMIVWFIHSLFPNFARNTRMQQCCGLQGYLLSSSIGTTAHCGLWPVQQCPSIFSYLPPILSIFSLPALEDLFLLPLSIFSWVFLFFSSLPVLEWRSFWASYPSPFPLGDPNQLLSFALLFILLYFLLCSFLLVLDSSVCNVIT